MEDKYSRLIFIDTNILLIPLKPEGISVSDFKQVFNPFVDDLFIVPTVYSEYQENCTKIASNNSKALDSAFKDWTNSIRSLKSILVAENDCKKFISRALSNTVLESGQTIKEQVQKQYQKRCNETIKEMDPFVNSKRIDLGMTFSQKMQIYQEGEFRFNNKIPPGYEDNGKKGISKYSDLLIWKEIILATQQLCQNDSMFFTVYFVTNDRKEDWESDRSKEMMTAEFYEQTGHRFCLMTLKEFREENKTAIKKLPLQITKIQTYLDKNLTRKALYSLKVQLNILAPWGATYLNLDDYLSQDNKKIILNAIKMIPGAVDVIPLSFLDLSVRATNCAKNNGIETVGQFVKMTYQQLAETRNFGKYTVKELQDHSQMCLSAFGITGDDAIINSLEQ